MKLRVFAITVIWLPIVLVACGSGIEDQPETSESNEPQQLDPASEIIEEGRITDKDDQSSALWALRGELTYRDEYGVTRCGNSGFRLHGRQRWQA